MAVEDRNRDIEKLVIAQGKAISDFFGAEVPYPADRVLAVCEQIRQEKLWTPEPLFIPQRRLLEGASFPGLKRPLSSAFYGWMRKGYVEADADMLPGQWIIWDPIRRPNVKDGKQMYPDTNRFQELLASLRERQDGIEVPVHLSHLSKGSRFGISADEIDGSKKLVAGEVAKILGLQEGEVLSTPPYAVFVYMGNSRHPELGGADTSEWFKNVFEHGYRLVGGRSDFGGLSDVGDWHSVDHDDRIGFRLQVSFPSGA